ncbi:hypothetical protein ACO0LO_26825 [Undibacterium sp. TJN25]|uniref:hypothetical protein n=1 Tax=Undibacterium sp. TJN25 TaxID=3413056 RepID=UPI003BEFC5BE
MSISSIANSFSIAQLTQVGSTRQISYSNRADSSNRPAPPTGGGLPDATAQALSQNLGANSGSGNLVNTLA